MQRLLKRSTIWPALALALLAAGCSIQPLPSAGAPTPTMVEAAGDAARAPTSTPAPTSTAPPTATGLPGATATPAPTATVDAAQLAPAANVPNVRVSRDQYTAHSEVALAQNPRDPNNFVGASKMFTDNQNYIFRIGTYASRDGGQTWIDNGQLTGLEQYKLTSDPVVMFDNNGTAYIEVLAARDAEQHSALYLYKSSDGGQTWSAPMVVSADTRGFNDKNWFTVDTTGGPNDGTLYTTWVQITNEQYYVTFARSTDGGETWSAPLELAGGQDITRQGQIVSVDAAGTVFVLWNNMTTNRLEVVASTDGGQTWSAIRTGPAVQPVEPLNGNLRRSFVLPAFAADPSTPDTLYTVWDDGRLGNSDVLFSASRDGGQTWSDPVVITRVATNDQFQPWVSLDRNGEIFVQWFDRRDDPANLLVHTYAARSLDGGATWSELRVTDVASDPTLGLPMAGDAGFYGDYQSLTADEDSVQLFWNETRDGSQEVYTAQIADDQWPQPQPVQRAGPPDPNASPRPEAEEEEAGD